MGTILAVRSAIVPAKVLDSQRKHKVDEVAALENPPGSESGLDLLAWEVGELRGFLERYVLSTAASTWRAGTSGS